MLFRSGGLEGVLGLIGLLVDELAADVVFVGKVGDGASGQCVEGELLSALPFLGACRGEQKPEAEHQFLDLAQGILDHLFGPVQV